MNLHQLRFATALARTGSFTAAATECSVTQPALSNAIAQLEDELGQKLFLRTTRKVELTSFGSHLLPDIQRILDAQHALVHRAKALLAPEQPLVRIGMSPLVNATFLNILLEPYRTRYPRTEIILREMNMSDLERLLEAEQLDFIFGVTPQSNGKRHKTRLYQEHLLYLPQGVTKIKVNGSGAVSFADIAGETFVMVPNACGLAQTVRDLFRRHRRKLNEYSGEAMSYQVLEQWAALGIGAAILPQSKLQGTNAQTARILDKKNKEILLNFEAIWKPQTESIAHLKEFSTYLKTVVPALSDGLADNPAR